jgi:hypothetical protein
MQRRCGRQLRLPLLLSRLRHVIDTAPVWDKAGLRARPLGL